VEGCKLVGECDHGEEMTLPSDRAGVLFIAMKTTYWVSGLLVAGLLGLAGCGKSGDVGDRGLPPAMDLPKFQQAFPSPTPEQKNNIAKVSEGVRYGLYPNALAALDKLAADPALSEAQKKAVGDLAAGIKQTMTKTPAPTGR
jgi:hypothetical protein